MASQQFEILPTKNIAKKYAELTNAFLIESFYEEKSFICCFIRDLTFANICNAINEIVSDEENDFYKLKISIFDGYLDDFYKHFKLVNLECKNNNVVVEYSLAGIREFLPECINYSSMEDEYPTDCLGDYCNKITFAINDIDQSILQTNGKENEFVIKGLFHRFE
jgi:hypothetical protein